MSKIISTATLTGYMNTTLNAPIAQQVVSAVNQYIESRTHRCWGETQTVTERYDWAPSIWLRHMDVNTNQGPNVVAMGVPNLTTPTSASTGGSLPAGTYYYVVTALSDYAQTTDEQTGETSASNEVSVTTTGSSSTGTLSWTPIVNAAGYNIYRGLSAGNETLLATVGDVTTFTDTGADSPGTQTPPVVSGGMTINLGYPHLLQSTLDNTSFFWNQWGRVTMYLQAPMDFNPSAVNNDLVEIIYTYGITDVPDDLTGAALGVAAQVYNWAVNDNKDIVSASVGTFRLQYAGSVRGVGGGPDGNAPPEAIVTNQLNFNIIDSYKMRRV